MAIARTQTTPPRPTPSDHFNNIRLLLSQFRIRDCGYSTSKISTSVQSTVLFGYLGHASLVNTRKYLQIASKRRDQFASQMLWFAQGSAGYGKYFRAATIALEVSSRNERVAALQKRWGRLRAELDLILDHGADMDRSACGASGMLVRDYKGKEADRLVTRIG